MLLLTNPLIISSFWNHVRITENHELEMTHKNHWVQLLPLDRTTPKTFTAFLYYFFSLMLGNCCCSWGWETWNKQNTDMARGYEAVDGHTAPECSSWSQQRAHVCEITTPSIIIITLGIYNVENPIQINKQTINLIMRRQRHPVLPAKSEGVDLHI